MEHKHLLFYRFFNIKFIIILLFVFLFISLKYKNYHSYSFIFKHQPKISIFIPIYNSEKYINKCIQSLQNQTLKDIEIIAVNDYSNDSSLNILL